MEPCGSPFHAAAADRAWNTLKAADKILFDMADIESFDPDGKPHRNAGGGEIAHAPYCGETGPGGVCHPNRDGSLRIAKAFWWLMSETVRDRTFMRVKGSDPNGARFQPTVRADAGTGRFVLIINLTEPEPVAVGIFDVLGRTVAGAAARRLPPGKHRIPIVPNNGFLSSGLYVVSVTTPSFRKNIPVRHVK